MFILSMFYSSRCFASPSLSAVVFHTMLMPLRVADIFFFFQEERCASMHFRFHFLSFTIVFIRLLAFHLSFAISLRHY